MHPKSHSTVCTFKCTIRAAWKSMLAQLCSNCRLCLQTQVQIELPDFSHWQTWKQTTYNFLAWWTLHCRRLSWQWWHLQGQTKAGLMKSQTDRGFITQLYKTIDIQDLQDGQTTNPLWTPTQMLRCSIKWKISIELMLSLSTHYSFALYHITHSLSYTNLLKHVQRLINPTLFPYNGQH